MDYSFLVGVHDLEKGNKDMVREKSLITMDVRHFAPLYSFSAKHLILQF